jgi:archaellum biogenesis ATPase FlaH
MDGPLPSNVSIERLTLGAILVNSPQATAALETLRAADFCTEANRLIFSCMQRLNAANSVVDRVTVLEDLKKCGQLDSVGGVSYVIGLDDAMPPILHLDSWIALLREKGELRRLAHASQHAVNRVLAGEGGALEIVADLAEQLGEIGQNSAGNRINSVVALLSISERSSEMIRYLIEPELPEGSVIALTGDASSGKSSLATAWARDLAAAGRSSLFLDRDNPIAVIADRFRRLRVTDESLIKVWDGSVKDPTPMPDDRRVTEFVKTTDPKPLVVIDSLSSFHGGNENDAGEMRAFMNRSRAIANLGATVLIIHHEGKSETSKDYRGSSDFKAALDVGFHCSNFGSDRLDSIRLRCFKSRFGFAGAILYRYADGRMTKDGDRAADACATTGQLTAILRENPQSTLRTLLKLAQVKGIGRIKVQDFLETGVHFGQVRRVPGPRNSQLFECVFGTNTLASVQHGENTLQHTRSESWNGE